MNLYSVRLWLTILSLIILPDTTSGYRILGVFPHIGASHHYAFDPLMKGLAEKGHEVTMITHFPTETPIKNYKDISLRGSLPIWFAGFRFDFFGSHVVIAKIFRHILNTAGLFTAGYSTCRAMLENEEVQAIKKGDYDIVIVEQFNSDCGLGIVHKLGVPFIGVTSHSVIQWTYSRVDAIVNPAFVINTFLEHGRDPSFFGKVEALILHVFYNTVHYFYSKVEHYTMKQYYGEDLPPLENIARNMSLLLSNTYFSLTSSVPKAPNFVDMGGMHLQRKNNISLEITKYLDESKNGVILFSMGSMLIASLWPEETLKAFQEAFKEIPYNVLWKWDNSTMPGISENIKLVQWLPQFDVLHHKKIKAFITHSGMLGTIEAVHCGVPMINIPIYGDQFSNAAAVRDSGTGVTLDYFQITKESVAAALKRVFEPKMQQEAKRLSAIWKDRPMPPLETAIYWIEHVARHGGQHLRSAAADIPLYRYLLLDVIAFLITVTFCFVYITFKVWKCIFCLLRRYYFGKQKRE